jgi:hypothetical protein
MLEQQQVKRYVYLKIEELAFFMKDYISYLHKYISAKKEGEMRERIKKLTIFKENANYLIENTKTLEKNTIFYIATSKIYCRQNVFKIGHITADTKQALKSRLAQYNTGKAGDDLFYYIYVKIIHNASDIDVRLKRILKDFKHNKRKEMVIMNYEALIKIINLYINHNEEEYDTFNEIVNNYIRLYIDQPVNIIEPINIDKLFINEEKEEIKLTEKKRNNNMSSLTEEERRVKIIEHMNDFLSTTNGSFDYDLHKNKLRNITISWMSFISSFEEQYNIKTKRSMWKQLFKTITKVPCIDKVKWTGK